MRPGIEGVLTNQLVELRYRVCDILQDSVKMLQSPVFRFNDTQQLLVLQDRDKEKDKKKMIIVSYTTYYNPWYKLSLLITMIMYELYKIK